MAKAYSYIRMSTDIQLKGDSLRRQSELSEAFAQKRGLELQVGTEYRDIGMSAYSGEHAKRGAFKRFLADVEAEKIEKGSYLLVESLDRLSRQDVATALTPFLRLLDAGIIIATLLDEAEYSKKSVSGHMGLAQLMTSLLIMARAHEESRTKSMRLAQAWSNKRANIQSKKLTKVAPAWLELSEDGTEFKIVQERAEMVRKIFQDTAEGVGANLIVKLLNRGQQPTWGRSKGWRASYIKKILTSRTVLGEYQPFQVIDGVKRPLVAIPGYYPSIVSEELYYTAEAARIGRRHKGGRKGPQITNLFTGLLKCGYCGAPIYLRNKGNGPKGGRYLICNAAEREHACKAVAVPYPPFETQFFSLTADIQFDFHTIYESEGERSAQATQKARVQALESKVKNTEEGRDRLMQSIEQGVGFEAAQNALMGRLNATLAEIDQLRRELSDAKRDAVLSAAQASSSESHQEELAKLVVLMRSQKSEDHLSIRARLAQLLREVVERIDLFTCGYTGVGTDVEGFLARLRGLGYSDEAIDLVKVNLGIGSGEYGNFKYMIIARNKNYNMVSPGDLSHAPQDLLLPSVKSVQ